MTPMTTMTTIRVINMTRIVAIVVAHFLRFDHGTFLESFVHNGDPFGVVSMGKTCLPKWLILRFLFKFI